MYRIETANLATQPFRNRTLAWVIAGTLSLVSLALLVYFISEKRDADAQQETVKSQVAQLSRERGRLRSQAEEMRREMSPEDRALLDAAHLLIDRKRFDWSRLFADLERQVPAGVRVTRIKVRDVVQNRAGTFAELDLSVVGRQSEDVTKMMTEMSRNGSFAPEAVSETPRTGRGETGIEWTLRVRYTPRTGNEQPSGEQQAVANATASN